jgi:hypothetical protein
MPKTYEPIATYTASGSVATYTFSSIPSTYTDIVLVAATGCTVTSQGQTMRINGDTSSLYSNTGLRGNGSVVSSFRQTNNDSFLLSNIAEPPTTGTGVYIAQFMNYSNTTTFKTVLVRSNNGAAATETFVDLYRSTNAISSIQVNVTGGNFSSVSTMTLYGIKAA